MKKISFNKSLVLSSPHPYVLVTTIDQNNIPDIIGIGWWSFVSWDIPMIGISVGYKRYTFKNLEFLGEFGLCFPTISMRDGALKAGTMSGEGKDMFKLCGFEKSKSEFITPPLISGSKVSYECKVTKKFDFGDHRFYVADILNIWSSDSDENILFSSGYNRLV
jgi:flavin reductase (DIM6/NTAB) family NADH-FMN oxidoreductase RutF